MKQLREAYQLISLRDAAERAVRKVGAQSSSTRRKNLAALALRDDSSQHLLASKMAQLSSTGMTSLARLVCVDCDMR